MNYMTEVKISVIGAGSAVFAVTLVKDLSLSKCLEGSNIYLMDINKQRLEIIHSFAKKYIEETGTKITFKKTTDREEALRDSDFIINTALAASHNRLREGWHIAKELGYRFGGSLHIMHDEAFWINFYQYRLFDSILKDIKDLCPNAWYIQLANPVLAGITYLSRKYLGIKMVGLCHGFRGVYHIANVLGLGENYLDFEAIGINHFIWLTKFYYKEENAYPILDKWIIEKAKDYWDKCKMSDSMGPKAIDVYQKLGLMPIGDTCTPGGGSWPYWYHGSKDEEKRWREDPEGWWYSYFAHHRDIFEKILILLSSNTKLTSVFKPCKSHEIIIPLIESLACNIPRKLQVNVPNTENFINDIPQNFEVELPLLIDRKGYHKEETKKLPKKILTHMYRDRIAPVEIELEAYESGNKDLLLQLILMDPWTKSISQAEKLLNKILSLPYHKDMKKHFR